MNTPPVELHGGDIARALRAGWDLAVDAEAVAYVPRGFGSHHWVAVARDRGRYFLTVDELDRKGWLGSEPDQVFRGLTAAFATALALHDEAGLNFVLPPIPTVGGEPLVRLNRRFSMAVFPFVDGTPGRFGDQPADRDRATLLRLLAELHGATATVERRAPRRDAAVPGRAALEIALRELNAPWQGGPFAEPARRLLAAHSDTVGGWLARCDRLETQVAGSGRTPVVTHGEPHGGNIVRLDGGLVLVDWDTVALAPPERDLWMLDDGSDDALAAYAADTGRTTDESAMALYRLAWTIADVAEYVSLFRSPHAATADAQKSWGHLAEALGAA